MSWQQRELDIFEITSRLSSAVSLAGASFIILTFCTSKNFHRPINRLAFYASFGNIITNVATLYSREGIRAGRESRLCQAQAAIIQWAIPADALFCLAMSLNVYLTVFLKKTTKQLRVLEPVYIVLCYGVPLIPSLVFLLYNNKVKGKIYGPATLWCWIDNEWQILRIAAFYGPIWIVLGVTFGIYLRAGRVIFRLRRHLREFAKDTVESPLPTPQVPREQVIVVPGKIAVTTVDTVETISLEDLDTGKQRKGEPSGAFPGLSYHANAGVIAGFSSYTCHIEAAPGRPFQKANRAIEANTAAWAYCRCAMLFFLALLITWLPSSINRLFNLADPNAIHFGLNFAAALVLPAQGFWNGLIYIVTTFPACKEWVGNIWTQIQRPVMLCREKCPQRLRKHPSTHSLSSV